MGRGVVWGEEEEKMKSERGGDKMYREEDWRRRGKTWNRRER